MTAVDEIELAGGAPTAMRTNRSRRRRTRMIAAATAAALAAAAGGGWYWYDRRESGGTADAAAATTTEQSLVAVTSGEIVGTVSAEGTVAAAATESLSFSTAGTVTAVDVAVGDTVAAGDVLATIDSAELQQALAEAQAAAADAEAQLVDDVEALADDADAVSDEQLAADQARQQVAADALADAYTAYVERDLVASIDGTVTAVNVTADEELGSGGAGGTSQTGSGSGSGNSNASIGAGTGGFGSDTSSTDSAGDIEIVSAGRYTVELSIGSTDIGAVAVGQTVTLTESDSSSSNTGGFPGGAGGFPGGGFPGGGFPGQQSAAGEQSGDQDDEQGSATTDEADTAPTAATDGFSATGTVTDVATVADASSGVASYAVTVEFADESGDVYIGSSVIAEIETERRTDVVQVQAQAITTDADGNTTVVVALDGTLDGATETRIVTTGAISGTMIEITSGLELGERVIAARTVIAGGPGGAGFPGSQLPDGVELPDGFPAGGPQGGGQ